MRRAARMQAFRRAEKAGWEWVDRRSEEGQPAGDEDDGSAPTTSSVDPDSDGGFAFLLQSVRPHPHDTPPPAPPPEPELLEEV